MATEDTPVAIYQNRQLQIFAVIFALLLAVLAAAYYYYLRTDYIVLFSELRPVDASAMVQELDKRGTPYELRDDGSTILVPKDEAARARVALAGSNSSVKDIVGFELFNESDMGLTDFAQRVNYQRALQGELARTIMMMDGIDSARVHLALPERTLFRTNQAAAKAAVTVIPKKDGRLDDGRVAGIQRLVAAAVPDLSLDEVVVLDATGRTISSAAAADPLISPQSEERAGLEQYYRARGREALEKVLGSQPFEVRVIATPAQGSGARRDIPGFGAGAGSANRNFRLRIVVLTDSELSAAEQSLARNAVAGAAGLNESAGDVITMGVAPIGGPASASDPLDSRGRRDVVISSSGKPEPTFASWWFVLALVPALLVGFYLFRPSQTVLSTEERDRFVNRIRTQLKFARGAVDVGP